MTGGTAISCIGLSKTYPSGTPALQDLTLGVQRGESFGLLGENGAGKSTLVRLVMGFIHPTAGEIELLGEREVQRAHPRVGYLPEHNVFEPRFSARRYLGYMAELSGLFGRERDRRVAGALEKVGLASAAGERLGNYSKGMLQRMSLARALLTDPELLILDEPTDGLDPLSRWQVRQVLEGCKERGVTLLLCSHNLAEVEALCTSVAILRRGRLVEAGPLSQLRASTEVTEIVLGGDLEAASVVERCSLQPYVLASETNALRLRTADQPVVLRALLDAEVPVVSLRVLEETLEDVYLRATRREVAAGSER